MGVMGTPFKWTGFACGQGLAGLADAMPRIGWMQVFGSAGSALMKIGVCRFGRRSMAWKQVKSEPLTLHGGGRRSCIRYF
jgi:hypothetical protein